MITNELIDEAERIKNVQNFNKNVNLEKKEKNKKKVKEMQNIQDTDDLAEQVNNN